MNTPLDRKSLTFAQAEGIDALPSQLERTVVSKELRAKLWAFVHSHVAPAYSKIYQGHQSPWREILQDLHVHHHHHLRIDKHNWNGTVDRIGTLFENGKYHEGYGWLEFVIKNCPPNFAPGIQIILQECRAPFRIEDDVFWPLASPEEEAALRQAMAAVGASRFSGAKTHLTNAASHLTQGEFAASVRESITAVESVARVLESTGDLSKALAGLEQRLNINPALKRGFLALYGYASDEKGIRHALLDSGGADVDETDAIFFIGACASFVTYMISKATKAGMA